MADRPVARRATLIKGSRHVLTRMAARAWALVATLLFASAALAGCTKPDAGDDGAPTTPTLPTGGSDGGGTGATPEDFLLDDGGTIQGPFSQSWNIEISNVAYSMAMVHFELAGLEAGAPPTARVNLQLADPDGNVVKSAIVGVGGDGNAASWDLTPAETPVPGTYVLSAVAGSDAPVPSLGLATWSLHAEVMY